MTDRRLAKVSTLIDRAIELSDAAIADATKRAYRTDWSNFVTWCAALGLAELPARPDTVAAYIVHLDELGRAPATIDRALVAISQAHKLAGHEPSPTASKAARRPLEGIKRTRGTKQKKAAPITLMHLRRMVAACDSSPRGQRDRALVLVGWAGGFRRSELVSLDLEHIHATNEGLRVELGRSKTDQTGAGRVLGIPYGTYQAAGAWPTCPVRALEAWIELAAIDGGPLFRAVRRGGHISGDRLTARTVDKIVRRLVAAAGFRPDNYSAHSLRSGLATAWAAADVPERRIMAHLGHRSTATVRGYITEGSIFLKNPLAHLL